MSTTRDLYEIFNPELINTTGWSVKAFALLASSFQNAILMDADVVFLQPPEILLESELFQTKRALFYQDRTMYSVTLEMLDMANNWIQKMSPKPFKSEYQSNRFLKSTSSHQQESGVVVIDKKARFMGLLSTCILNVNRVRDVAYGHMYGDKETFWIGFEIVGEPYAFNPYIPGAMSDKMTVDQSNNSEICSVQLIHVDENYEPIWINGGLTLNKHNGASGVPDFRFYLIETNQKGHQQATWHLKDGWFFCLTSKNSLVEFPDSSIQVFQFAKPYLEDLLSKKL